MARGGSVSEYRQLVSIARRQGRSMADIGAAWRGANLRLHGSPVDPDRLRRLARETRTGRYLAEGMPFSRALALASSSRPNPDAAKRTAFGRSSRRDVYTRRQPNPTGTNWRPLVAIGAVLALFAWRGSASSTSNITTSAAPQGPAQLPQPTALIPYATWWSKYVNHGQGVPITSQFPDVYVYDTPDGGMIGVPIPPPIQ
jgi:hypothetical protein